MHGIKSIFIGLVLAAGVLLAQSVLAAGPAPIDLKSCSNFAILAYSTITSTGGGTINGDVGLSPAGSVVGFPPATCNGTIYNGGPIAAQAQLDLNDAIIAASPGQLTGGIVLSDLELGGRTLTPGVYKSGSSYDITLVDLTLNGGPDDIWVFQMASTLTVGVGRQVILIGGAQAKNIFWQVGSSATLKTSSVFKGTIMADASITMDAGATMDGRALAQNGAVTFNGSNDSLPKSSQTITNFMPTNGSAFEVTNVVGLSAQASSGLPVSFAVTSGPGAITGGTNLAFTATGEVSIVASQTGNTFYAAAPDVTNTFYAYKADILSISVAPSTWAVGTVATSTVNMSAATNKISVANDGNVAETFTINISDEDDQNEWTHSPAKSGAGDKIYVLSGIFCAGADVPGQASFNQTANEDVLTTTEQNATAAQFAYAEGTATGVAVPAGAGRSLWLRLDTPTAGTGGIKHTITVRVGCIQP